MKYMDEMRGSEGESCYVIDVSREDFLIPGTVVSLDEARGLVYVQLDAGGEPIHVPYTRVALEGEAA